MEFIFGFAMAALLLIFGLQIFIASIHGASSLRPLMRFHFKPPSLSRRAIISASIILPTCFLGPVFIFFPVVTVTKGLMGSGQGKEAALALMLPLLGFTLGFMYLKKAMKG